MFVDDAAIFPPARTPLPEAVAAHRTHRASEYAAMVGGFVISDVLIGDLAAAVAEQPRVPLGETLLDPIGKGRTTTPMLEKQHAAPVVQERGTSLSKSPPQPLEINLVVTGGAGAIEPAVTWLGRSEGLTLRAVEFALRDEDDLAHNARRLARVVDSLEEALEGVMVFAEPPMPRGGPTHGWLSALDELATQGISCKFRTGGLSEDLFPSSATLAACITSVLDRELPFKCTAGLHQAGCHVDAETGFRHHGFLNVLLATQASLAGGDLAEVAGVLETNDAATLASLVSADPGEAARTRRWFTSFGSCSVLEAHEDLVGLGLLDVTQ